jgi:hypothetical protein
MLGTFQRLATLLRQHAPPSFRWRSDITRGAAHRDNDAISTPVALQTYFRREASSPDTGATVLP